MSCAGAAEGGALAAQSGPNLCQDGKLECIYTWFLTRFQPQLMYKMFSLLDQEGTKAAISNPCVERVDEYQMVNSTAD